MKKKIILFTILAVTFTFYSFEKLRENSENHFKSNYSPNRNFTLDSKKLDVNNVSTWFMNNGNFNRNPSTFDAGFEWPKGSNNTLRYSSGFWIGCTVGSDTLTAVAEYEYDYKPGYVDNNGNPQGQSDPLYRIYKIVKGDTTSPDYQNWPANQGAYVTPQGKPFFLGTQTMFYSYTDAYPHSTILSSDSSLKVQILQTNWAYENTLRDVVFSEFKIINRSHSTWNNAYLSVWTDDDVGITTNNKIACDTVRNMQYTYIAHNNDPLYGVSPPCVGTRVLRSPVTYTGNTNDTVKFYDPPGSQNLRIKTGYKFTGVSVYHAYNNAAPFPRDPQSNTETYRALRGIWNDGSFWIDPFTNQPSTKPFSGDPVTGAGWLMTNEGNKKSLISCGPLNMNPNDTQSIIIAQVVGRGPSYLSGISSMRSLSDIVQSVYNENFQNVLAVNNISTEVPAQFTLSQNYPNPFNPVTVINYELRVTNYVSLTVYDALGKLVATLVNEKQNAGTYEVEFDGNELTSGVYFYRLNTDGFSDTKRMILLK